MASIRIRAFAGIMPAVEQSLLPHGNAVVAHNCILWDGSLRPMAEWVRLTHYADTQMFGIQYDPAADKAFTYYLREPVHTYGEPFVPSTVIGPDVSEGRLYRGQIGIPQPSLAVGVSSALLGGIVSYERAYLSDKPVNRLYGVTRVHKLLGRAEESTLRVLEDQNPNEVVYEGDTATITVTGVWSAEGGVRIYRTITGLDTGESVSNELDTNWHLIADLEPTDGTLVYIDGGSVTNDPLDVYYSDEFFPPQIGTRFFGLTESGWFVGAGVNGNVQVSERYMHHAWPTSNKAKIPATVHSMAVSDDNVYFGTDASPYIMSLASAEKATQIGARPYGENYPCVGDTMWATPSGAMYCANVGVVAIGRDGMQVITSKTANPGDVLYENKYGAIPVRFDTANFGVYDSGWYYGFCGEIAEEIID